MKTPEKILLSLSALALLFGCRSADDAADVSSESGRTAPLPPIVQPSVHEMEAPNVAGTPKESPEKATEQPSVPAPASSENTPPKQDSENGTPQRLPPQPPPAPSVPAQKTPATEPAPARNAEKVRPLKFRCAYWSAAAKPPELFFKERGKYTHMVIFEMAFLNLFSVPAESPLVLYAKNPRGNYEPYCALDTQGLDDCAALILPGYDPASRDPETRKFIRLFNFSEKAFPRGAYKIYNFSTRPLELRIRSEKASEASTVVVQPGASVLAPKSSREQERFDFEAYALPDAADGEEAHAKLIWKTIGFLKNDERICMILTEDRIRSRETGKLKLTTKSIPVPEA